MEVKKSHKNRRQRSNMESRPGSDIREQIERISTVSGSNSQRPKFHRKKKEEAESPAPKNLVKRIKNINLYEDDVAKNSKRPSASLEKYAEEHEITAAIRSMNGGVSHSNQKMERAWSVNDKSLESPGSSMSGDSEETKAAISSLKRDEEKYKNNVLISSILKRREEELGNKPKLDKTSSNAGVNEGSENHYLPHHIVRDPYDPDFYYRRTTVADPDADYTVEHVGNVNVVRPRAYLIASFNDDDFAFRQRNPRRSVLSFVTFIGGPNDGARKSEPACDLP